MKHTIKELETIANTIREDIINMLVAAGSGHSAGPLGMADVFTALYFEIMDYDAKNPEHPDRDRLILSNGHICPVRYAAMAEAGFFPKEELLTLRKRKVEIALSVDGSGGEETFQQILSTFQFLGQNAKGITSTYTLMLPTEYTLIGTSENKVTYGFGGFEYLTVSNINSIDLSKITKCETPPPGQFCLADGKGYGQNGDIVDTTLDNLPAKSFYIFGGVDNVYHIVQSTNGQFELKMYVAGGGLDQTFSQILSTFKFTQ